MVVECCDHTDYYWSCFYHKGCIWLSPKQQCRDCTAQVHVAATPGAPGTPRGNGTGTPSTTGWCLEPWEKDWKQLKLLTVGWLQDDKMYTINYQLDFDGYFGPRGHRCRECHFPWCNWARKVSRILNGWPSVFKQHVDRWFYSSSIVKLGNPNLKKDSDGWGQFVWPSGKLAEVSAFLAVAHGRHVRCDQLFGSEQNDSCFGVPQGRQSAPSAPALGNSDAVWRTKFFYSHYRMDLHKLYHGCL